jgi:hypothetical protein
MNSTALKFSNFQIENGRASVPPNSVDLLSFLIKNKQPTISTPFGPIDVDDIGVEPNGSILFKNPIFVDKVKHAKALSPNAFINIGSCVEVNGAC